MGNRQDNKIIEYWNQRSKNFKFAGAKNPITDELEKNYLIKFVRKKKAILDVGCGAGNLLKSFNHLSKDLTGIDVSQGMINQAKKKYKKINFLVADVIDEKNFSTSIKNKKFDLIFTKRCIQNILSQKKQLKIINFLGSKLKKNGKLILCESSATAQKDINVLRKKIGLKKITPPWHNLFFDDRKIQKTKFKNLKLREIHSFMATFFFVTRIINAYIKNKEGKKPHYLDSHNILAKNLPQNLLSKFSQTKVYEFIKI